MLYFYPCSRHYIEKAKNKDEELNEDNFISAFLLEKEKLEEQGKPTNLDGKSPTIVKWVVDL